MVVIKHLHGIAISTITRSKGFYKQFLFSLRGFKSKGRPARIIRNYHYSNDDQAKVLCEVVENAINEAKKTVIQNIRIRNMSGMSGQGFRTFLNFIVSSRAPLAYLEIGVWGGSTAISALYQNLSQGILVDNWSQFGGPKELANQRLIEIIGPHRYKLKDVDFNSFCESRLETEIGVYFYDGDHSVQSQEKAVTYIENLHFDYLIFIVDDYNWSEVREGTQNGLSKLSKQILATWIIEPHKKDEFFKYGNWHNGYFVAIVKAKDKI